MTVPGFVGRASASALGLIVIAVAVWYVAGEREERYPTAVSCAFLFGAYVLLQAWKSMRAEKQKTSSP